MVALGCIVPQHNTKREGAPPPKEYTNKFHYLTNSQAAQLKRETSKKRQMIIA